MKHILTQTCLLLLFQFFTCGYAAAATDKYTFDPQHTSILWHISHFGFSNPSGKWFATGTLTIDESKPQNAKVNIVIDVANLVTGIPELDKHLKGGLFFDVEKYPKATFASDKIEVTGKNTAKVYGTLTMHGISQRVILVVKLNKVDLSPISNKKTAGFSASTQIKRSNFGINTLLPGLGDEVKIDIEAEAIKDS